MTIVPIDDLAIVREATELLFKHLPPSKVARLMMLWRMGSGDYVAERRRLFKGETVDSLFTQAKALEKTRFSAVSSGMKASGRRGFSRRELGT